MTHIYTDMQSEKRAIGKLTWIMYTYNRIGLLEKIYFFFSFSIFGLLKSICLRYIYTWCYDPKCLLRFKKLPTKHNIIFRRLANKYEKMKKKYRISKKNLSRTLHRRQQKKNERKKNRLK